MFGGSQAASCVQMSQPSTVPGFGRNLTQADGSFDSKAFTYPHHSEILEKRESSGAGLRHRRLVDQQPSTQIVVSRRSKRAVTRTETGQRTTKRRESTQIEARFGLSVRCMACCALSCMALSCVAGRGFDLVRLVQH